MTDTLLQRHPLANGLIMEFHDLSKPMAGGRWQVILEVRLPIPVDFTTISSDLADQAPLVIAALGPEIVFTQQEVHYFIDVQKVPDLLHEIQTRFIQGLEGYLGHPDFASRYIRKKFTEHQKEARSRR
jgi:hypothetical protein